MRVITRLAADAAAMRRALLVLRCVSENDRRRRRPQFVGEAADDWAEHPAEREMLNEKPSDQVVTLAHVFDLPGASQTDPARTTSLEFLPGKLLADACLDLGLNRPGLVGGS